MEFVALNEWNVLIFHLYLLLIFTITLATISKFLTIIVKYSRSFFFAIFLNLFKKNQIHVDRYFKSDMRCKIML